MAKHILRYEEWEVCGNWYCSAIKEVGKIGNKWYTPARALGMELTDFIQLLVDKFKPDRLAFTDGPNGTMLHYSWKSQAAMRKFKNWLNAELRRVQFYVD